MHGFQPWRCCWWNWPLLATSELGLSQFGCAKLPKKTRRGQLLKWWVSHAFPNKPMGFPLLKMIMTWGVKWGEAHHLRKHPPKTHSAKPLLFSDGQSKELSTAVDQLLGYGSFFWIFFEEINTMCSLPNIKLYSILFDSFCLIGFEFGWVGTT